MDHSKLPRRMHAIKTRALLLHFPEAPLPEAPLPEAPLPEAPLPEAPLPEASIPEASIPEAPLPEAPQFFSHPGSAERHQQLRMRS